jgi:histone H3/H4
LSDKNQINSNPLFIHSTPSSVITTNINNNNMSTTATMTITETGEAIEERGAATKEPTPRSATSKKPAKTTTIPTKTQVRKKTGDASVEVSEGDDATGKKKKKAYKSSVVPFPVKSIGKTPYLKKLPIKTFNPETGKFRKSSVVQRRIKKLNHYQKQSASIPKMWPKTGTLKSAIKKIGQRLAAIDKKSQEQIRELNGKRMGDDQEEVEGEDGSTWKVSETTLIKMKHAVNMFMCKTLEQAHAYSCSRTKYGIRTTEKDLQQALRRNNTFLTPNGLDLSVIFKTRLVIVPRKTDKVSVMGEDQEVQKIYKGQSLEALLAKSGVVTSSMGLKVAINRLAYIWLADVLARCKHLASVDARKTIQDRDLLIVLQLTQGITLLG